MLGCLHACDRLPESDLDRRAVADDFRDHNPIAQAVRELKVAERTLKRRFKRATGSTLIDYVQNLRVEDAKRLL